VPVRSFVNLPNTITIVRAVLIPFFVDLMFYGYYRPAMYIFLVACLTDALDGMIARLTHTQTELGAFLDPVADKLLIVSSFITLAFLGPIPIWLVIIVVSRDIILVLGSMVIYFTGHRLTIRPSVIGKLTTFLQLLVVTLALVLMAYRISTRFLWVAYWCTAAATIVSGIQYVTQGMNLMGNHDDPYRRKS
jgi:cardiolipin synthase